MSPRSLPLTFAALFASFADAAVVKSLPHNGLAWFLHDSPARLVRYDLNARQWLQEIALPTARGTATTCLVDGDGIYVAYGVSVYRYDLSGQSETHLVTAPQTVQALHSDGSLLFVNHSTSSYAKFISLSKTTNTQIATFEQYIYSTHGSAIAPSQNKIFGRSQGTSPSDIAFVSYTDAGAFSAGGDSPYHGDYPSATKTWVFPNEARVLDDSGTTYSTGNLTYTGSFGGTISDLAFLGTDVPVVLRSNEIIAYTSTLLPTGSKVLSYTPIRIFINATDVLTFTVDGAETSGLKARAEALAQLSPPIPGLPVDPAGLAYTPDLVFQDVNGIVCLFHKNSQSIFRWNPATQQYLQTIPLVGIPSYAAYSPALHRVYLAYPSGLIRAIALDDPALAETPFYALPSAPNGLSTAGQYLFAVDGSGAWNTHYSINSAGALVDAVDWNYYSASFVWSEINQKMYFFRDDTSPNDILWEEINANGIAYAGEAQGGIRNKMDSPYHGEDSFVHPIRVSPDGSVVITGTGFLYNAQTLVRGANVLPNAIADASWLSGGLRTVRTITGVTQYQQWTGPTYAAGLVKQYPGAAHRLLTHGTSQLVGISTATDGRPSFYVLDSNFEIVAPPSLAKPGNLIAPSISTTQVMIAWADVSGETSYTVERKTGVGGTWAAIGTTTVSVSAFTDTGVVVGNQYYYRVYASNGALASLASNDLAVSVTPPAVPSPVTAAADSSSAITLTWPNVASETGYKIERASSISGPWTQIATPAANVVSFQSTGLTQSTTYFYRIRSTNSIGDSAYSEVVSATTLLAPPSVPSVFVSSSLYYQVALSWTNVGFETGYVLERSPTSSGTWAVLATLPADTTSYTDTTVTSSTLFYYRVKAFNAAGESLYSTTSTTTPAPSPPAAPAGVVLRVISGTQLRISWNNVLDETGYLVERRTDDPLSWQQVGSVGANLLMFDDTAVQAGLQYWYRIRSFNAVGTSAASAEVTGIAVDLAIIAQDDFDPGADAAVWSSISSGVATNGGAGFLGSNALWFGASGTRSTTTVPLNIIQVGYIEFKIRAGNQTVDGTTYWNNCESGETVVLEYSVDGTTWTSLQSLNTVYPSHSNWTSYFLPVPTAAVSPATRFRWRQLTHSGGTNDTWALEDVNVHSGLPPLPLPPPFIITSPNSATTIAIYWAASSGAAGYQVERTADGSVWTHIASVAASQTFHTDAGLMPATWYQYRIRATNISGVSQPGSTSLVATLSRIGEWRLANFGTTSSSGSSASDFEGTDGIKNLAKYAYNMNQGDGLMYVEQGSGGKGLPVTRIDPVTRRLRVEFIRRKSSSLPGISYSVEFCSSLDAFAPHGAAVQVISINDLFERVVWEDNLSLDDVPTRFARVKVVENL